MTNVYQELAKKMGMEKSPLIPLIWQAICSDKEAGVVNATPGTALEIASRVGLTGEETEGILRDLFRRGVVFDKEREGILTYRMPAQIIQFHDASILWPEAPPELLHLWRRYMEEEYPQIPALLTEIKAKPFLRVIPVRESLDQRSQVLLFEDAVGIVEEAVNLSVTACPCRLVAGKCDRPLEVCIQLNRGADYAQKRGVGRKITAPEAKEILRKAAAAGLVHLAENRQGVGNVICNCCNCCCIALSYVNNPKTRGVVQASGFRVALTKENCTSCGQCVDICPASVIWLADDGLPGFEKEKCLGCGLCAGHCPPGALTLLPISQTG